MSMHGPRPMRLQPLAPTMLPDAGPARAQQVRVPDGEVHRLTTVVFNSGAGYTYRTGCGSRLSAINGAMRTTFPISCQLAGCTRFSPC